MYKKSFKKNNLKTLLIILSLICGFLQVINFAPKNQILTDINFFNDKNAENVNIAAIIGSDWEVARSDRDTIAIINKPSGTQEGDLLILHCTTDGDDENLTGPSGWSILLDEERSGGQTTASWFKIAGDSEQINYNVSWVGNEAYVAGIIRIKGHDRNNPIQTTATGTGTGDIINPSVNTTKGYTLIVGFHGIDGDSQLDNYGGYLESGPTVLYARISGGSQPCSAGMYYEIQTNQGPSLNRTWDINGTENWYAATAAINLEVPFINIISPIEDEMFGTIAPNYIVEIVDPNLDTMWYTMDGGLNNYSFTENGTIYQAAWAALPDGVINLQFYANNSLGDITYQQVNIIKDGSAPIIDIISPVDSEIFGINPPTFIVEITDINLETMWYSIFNGSHQSLNITFIDNGTIDPTEWGALYDGTYILRFYANDTLGNINFEDVDIIKDMYAIVINITSPIENEIFGVVAPNFTVEITGTNINTSWYTVDGGINNYTFTENGTINQEAWDGLSDGIVTIRFYANNTSGKLYFKQVNVVKDSSAPMINIISPIPDEEFGVDPPSFIVEITDANLDRMWYLIFNGTHESLNITFTVNGTIDPTEWGALSNGEYTIRFYANNSLGNINYEEVNVTKDIYAIIIDILNPIENEIFGVSAPSFVVEITCAFLNTTWYTLDGAIDKYIFTVNETINQTAWEGLSDGVVSVRFYANNTIGDIEFEQVNIIKDASAPNINIINPLENEIFGVLPPNFTVEITDTNLDAMWYSIFNGTHQSLNISFTDNGTIDPTEWGALTNGEYTIRFYANDTLENINFEEVNITKDIYTILINIINPIENEIFGVNAPSFIVEITCAFLNITWYTVDGGLNNFTFTVNGTINAAAWSALSDGTVTIIFYANNSIGDVESEQVNIIKDASAPIINIISPSENDIFGVDAPSFSVDITDLNLDTMWYTVNNSATRFIVAQDGVIDQGIWDAQVDGDILLTFFANDTVGNLASDDIIIIKRTSYPESPDYSSIIVPVSVIAGVAAVAIALGVLIKKGKISLDKLSFRKLTAGRTKTEKVPKEKTKSEKAPKEKTETEKNPEETKE